MWKALERLPEQFSYEPVVENAGALKPFRHAIVAGMGGSRWPALLAARWISDKALSVHNSYGLPFIPADDRADTFVIASSFSGNTEEAVSAFDAAKEAGIAVGVVASGGVLIERARAVGAPYVQLPNPGVQPRMATGYLVRGMLALLGEREALAGTSALASSLRPGDLEAAGEALAERLRNRVPAVYASDLNAPIAYAWKIKLNETAKIPAFSNVLPELNHNEMNGFDAIDSTRALAKPFRFVLLRDSEDHPRIVKRMEVLDKLFRNRGFAVENVSFETGKGPYYKIFASLVLADWTAYHLSQFYGTEPEEVRMVEEFKRLITNDR